MVNFRLPSPSGLDGRCWLSCKWRLFTSAVAIVAVTVSGVNDHGSIVPIVEGGCVNMSLFGVHAVAAVVTLLESVRLAVFPVG